MFCNFPPKPEEQAVISVSTLQHRQTLCHPDLNSSLGIQSTCCICGGFLPIPPPHVMRQNTAMEPSMQSPISCPLPNDILGICFLPKTSGRLKDLLAAAHKQHRSLWCRLTLLHLTRHAKSIRGSTLNPEEKRTLHSNPV